MSLTKLHQRARMDRIDQAGRQLRAAFDNHGLSHDVLVDCLAVDDPTLEPILDWVFGTGGAVPSRVTMRRLVAVATEKLDLSDDAVTTDLSSPTLKVAHAVRSVFAGLVLVLSGWTVIGAIVTGQNELAASTSIGQTMAILVVAIVWLALLEAAHIGAVALSTADVSEMGTTHPRVVGLHHFIDTKNKLEKYLAARQVGVVLTVFLISEVTRTPGLQYLPGTSIAIPAAFGILFRIGAPGALLVLVLGQVLPQIITARRPAAMMNLLPMAGAFHATRFIGLLGLAEPASWFVAWSKTTERIPSAARQRYVSTTEDAAGYGTVATTSTVHVAEDATTVENTTTVAVYDRRWSNLKVDLAYLRGTPGQVHIDASILRRGQVFDAIWSEIEEERLASGHGLLSSTFSPRVGGFEPGDTLTVTSSLRFKGQVYGQAVLPVTVPTKIAILRVILKNPMVPLPPASFVVGHAAGSSTDTRSIIPPRLCADGSVEFMVMETYPEADSHLDLTWADEPVTRAAPGQLINAFPFPKAT